MHQPIVAPIIFNKVQKLIGENNKRKRRVPETRPALAAAAPIGVSAVKEMEGAAR